jgi:hypothetical protein
VVDLKAWTRDQIYEEAQRAFETVWQKRDRLGELPVAKGRNTSPPTPTRPESVPTLRDLVPTAGGMLADYQRLAAGSAE